MIDTSNILVSITMSDDDFANIAALGDSGPVIHVIEVDGGWAIYGPTGVYSSQSGDRIFSDLETIHRLIAKWGIKRFVQGKVVLVIP